MYVCVCVCERERERKRECIHTVCVNFLEKEVTLYSIYMTL